MADDNKEIPSLEDLKGWTSLEDELPPDKLIAPSAPPQEEEEDG